MLLRRAWRDDPHVKVILSDLNTLVIFHPPSGPDGLVVALEHGPKMADISVLRTIIAAYLNAALPKDVYLWPLLTPDLFEDRLPHGPSNDPTMAILPDDKVFATHQTHSDFDIPTVINHRLRAEQLVRWKVHMQATIPPHICAPGDTLRGQTWGFARRNSPLRPYYPADDLPADTMSHMQAVQRPEPLVGKARTTFASSDDFSLQLMQELAPKAEGRLSRTFMCHLVSIDGVETVPPRRLCVKLLDDRFHDIGLTEEVLTTSDVKRWFYKFIYAEDFVRREVAAYEKLKLVQGSLIPWFYGAHRVSFFDCLIDSVPANTRYSPVLTA